MGERRGGGAVRLARLGLLLSGGLAGETRRQAASHLGRIPEAGPKTGRPQAARRRIPSRGAPLAWLAGAAGPGWAGIVLLARAAPYATHPSNYSKLFSIETMEPLVDGPPFVRALEELVATARLWAAAAVDLRSDRDPPRVLARGVRAGAGVAIGRGQGLPQTSGQSPFGFGRTAGVRRRLQLLRPDLGVPAAGRRPSCTSAERGWSDGDGHRAIAVAAGRFLAAFVALRPAMEPADERRQSGHNPVPAVGRCPPPIMGGNGDARWSGRRICPSDAADPQPRAMPLCFTDPRAFGLPESPGRGSPAGGSGSEAPREALGQAAVRWREITKSHGIERQRAAYRHSLGL